MADDTAEIHVTDIGTILWAELRDENGDLLDPDDATWTIFFLQRKSKSDILEVEPEVAVDPFDQIKKFKYVCVEGDLSVEGDYLLQGYCILPDGTWHTSTHKFKVVSNIRNVPNTPQPGG